MANNQFARHQLHQQHSFYRQPVNQNQASSIAAQVPQSNVLPRRGAYFESHWPLAAASCAPSEWANGTQLVAVGTFTEDQSNRVQILHATRSIMPLSAVSMQSCSSTGSSSHPDKPSSMQLNFELASEAMVSYPLTKVGWEPRPTVGGDVKLITTAECLRLWNYNPDTREIKQHSALRNKSKQPVMPPVTSFDWNKVDPSLVITSSIDTTCTIWDINTSTARTQLIAHDNEVYDVTFLSGSVDVFTSVGADGSVRVFDLRSLDHSTIIYESSKPDPLLRIASNPVDHNMLATFAYNSHSAYVLDIRAPGVPLTTLEGHQRPINSIAWAPAGLNNGGSILATAADDSQVLLWNVSAPPYPLVSAYTDTSEVNNVTWSPSGEWLGVVSGRGFQGVRL